MIRMIPNISNKKYRCMVYISVKQSQLHLDVVETI